MAMRTLLLCLLVAACGEEDRRDEAKALVEQAFAEQNKGGQFGTEVLGKGVWYRSPLFDPGCLQAKNLAFGDDPRTRGPRDAPRISPTYDAQRFFTASSQQGYCVLLGTDLSMTVGEVEKFQDGAIIVNVTYSARDKAPFFACIDPAKLSVPVRVVAQEDGSLQVEGELGLSQGGCPSPLPEAVTTRKGKARPTERPSGRPSLDDARAAIKRLDDALYAHDARAALDAISCFNLFEDDKYGTCSTGEVLGLGPITRGSPRLEDAPPWNMNTFKSLDEIGPIFPDGQDPTLFHVQVKAASGKHKRRTLAIQWVGSEYKVVGVVGAKAEGLTTANLIYDLDRPDKRRIFERRLKGEAIGEDGLPADPMVRMGYEEAEE